MQNEKQTELIKLASKTTKIMPSSCTNNYEIYERTQKMISTKKAKIGVEIAKNHEKALADLAECSFHPKTNIKHTYQTHKQFLQNQEQWVRQKNEKCIHQKLE